MKTAHYFAQISKVLILLLLTTSSTRADELSQKIDRLMDSYVQQNLFSGTVLVGEDGKILYAKAFGHANKDFRVENSIDTKFNIASVGKTFTAVAIMQLAEQGKLSLEDSVVNFFPDWPHNRVPKVRHLLSHTAGLGNYMQHPEFEAKKPELRSLESLLPLIYEEPLQFEPGTQFRYSNSGYILLGLVIEKITGARYTDYIRDNIITPAGMTNTGWFFPEEIVRNRAAGYIKEITGGFTNNSQVDLPAFSDGGTLSTAEDLFRYHTALSEGKLLPQSALGKMFTPVSPDGNYGLGWIVDSLAGELMIGHTGGAPGVNAEFYRFPNAGNRVVIVLSNYSHASPGVGRRISALLFDQPYDMGKPKLGEFLYTQIRKRGISNVAKNLQQILKEGGYSIESDRDLNLMGYQLLAAGDVTNAVAIFQINTQLYPDEANTYDSLGEAYLIAGDTARAAMNYRKALELNPDNSNAKKVLQKIQQD